MSHQPEYLNALADLRHSTVLHLSIAGDFTADLAAISVSLLDVLDYEEQEAIEKMRDLSKWLVRRLCETVIKRARDLGCDIRYIESKYNSEGTKKELLSSLACCLREISNKTSTRCVDIWDVDGELL